MGFGKVGQFYHFALLCFFFLSRRPGVFDHWWRLEDDVKILQVLVLFILQNVALLRPRPLNRKK
jgi:hypothetical protein